MFKVGDYIWHGAGPVGLGVVTSVAGRLVGYTILLHNRTPLGPPIPRYTCEESGLHMILVSEEEATRAMLAGEYHVD